MQLLLIDGNHIMYSVLFRHIAKAKKRGDYEEATDRIVQKAAQQFTVTMRKLVRRFKPSHMIVIFDNDGQNFRHRLSPIYKANRKERPKEVHPLKQAIYSRFREEGIPYLYAQDYEGDDLLGTIATRAEAARSFRRIILCSGDMDLAQLITQKTQLYQINSGVFTGSWVTHKNVKEIVQVDPKKLPEIKALLGDRTDNIKGISGLRRPNALRVLETYPDLAEFLDSPKAKNKTEQLILSHRQHVLTNLELARIRCDLRFYMRWEDYLVNNWWGSDGSKSFMNAVEAEDADDELEESAAVATVEPGEEATPAKRKRKRRRKPKSTAASSLEPTEAQAPAPAPQPSLVAEDDAGTTEAKPKKKRPRRRRRRNPNAGSPSAPTEQPV
ncbi:5'-3' exonuclease [Tumebacillus permanentifrigoris]|uniref:5'-3' exonuclease n=1 Tax=Tumebacillus permanentifrigoris TaxID=378543 RepID=A0A316D7E2_9BACL|nr:5'-3' exonuclease H3TH domain-containing protein [Tumebacillus permanentifrigoris]PWK11219.1 5'-3' exonuclease [Tumebacillus permanentifrigoris]